MEEIMNRGISYAEANEVAVHIGLPGLVACTDADNVRQVARELFSE
jgi:hypothetical protein